MEYIESLLDKLDYREFEYYRDIEKEWKYPSARERDILLLPTLTKTFIRELIKKDNQKAYELLKRNEYWGITDIHHPFVTEHQQTLQRIRSYKQRLRGVHVARPGEITSETIARAKEHPIENYFGGGKLRQVGNRLIGKCPFHSGGQERTASFHIKGNKFKCFGCQESGDTIDYIRKVHNIGFIAAVKFLTN